jgi:hypothetical protein
MAHSSPDSAINHAAMIDHAAFFMPEAAIAGGG